MKTKKPKRTFPARVKADDPGPTGAQKPRKPAERKAASKDAVDDLLRQGYQSLDSAALVLDHGDQQQGLLLLQHALRLILAAQMCLHTGAYNQATLEKDCLDNDSVVPASKVVILKQVLNHTVSLEPTHPLPDLRQAFEDVDSLCRNVRNQWLEQRSQQTNPGLELFLWRRRKPLLGLVTSLAGCLLGLYGLFWWQAPEITKLATGQIYWTSNPQHPFNEHQTKWFNTVIDSQFNTYNIEFDPPIQVTQIRLDPAMEYLDGVMVDAITAISVDGQAAQRVALFDLSQIEAWKGTMSRKAVFQLGLIPQPEMEEKLSEQSFKTLEQHKQRLFFSEDAFRKFLQKKYVTQLESSWLTKRARTIRFQSRNIDPHIDSPPFKPLKIQNMEIRMKLSKRKSFWNWLLQG